MNYKAKIDKRGRLVIPAECREAAGMKPNIEVLIEMVGKGELRVLTRGRAIHKAQEIVERRVGKGRDLVGEFIAERRTS
jgi:AbrB family looped-hinge helix DNA binding protein